MTSREFCYWLQGHFEISKCKELDGPQTEMVKRHLALVFKHEIDPSYGGNSEELQAIHDGVPHKTKPKQYYPSDGDAQIRC